MLPVDRIKFTSWQIPGRDETVHAGELNQQVSFPVSKVESVPISVIKDHIKRHLWLTAYHELMGPMAELQNYALVNSRHDSEEIRRLCNRINLLLECPASTESGTTPA